MEGTAGSYKRLFGFHPPLCVANTTGGPFGFGQVVTR